MKKYLPSLGIVLTIFVVMIGCSGTSEPQATNGFSADGETVRIGSIDWYVSYDDALADAKRTNRPVWLHFGENPG